MGPRKAVPISTLSNVPLIERIQQYTWNTYYIYQAFFYFLGKDDEMLLCDGCDRGFHMSCLTPPLKNVPVGDWFCKDCKPVEVRRRRKHSKAVEETEDDETEEEEDTEEEDEEEESEEGSNEESEYEEEQEEEGIWMFVSFLVQLKCLHFSIKQLTQLN